MRIIGSAALGGLIIAAGAAPAVAAVAFESASTYAYASAYGGSAFNQSLTADVLPAAPLSSSLSATGNSQGKASINGSASFLDAAHGQVTVDPLSIKGHYGYPPGSSGGSAGFKFDYLFDVDRASIAQLTYDLTYGGQLPSETYVFYQLFKLADGGQTLISSAFFNDTGQDTVFTDTFAAGAYQLHIAAAGTLAANEFHVDKLSSVAGTVGFAILPTDRGPASPSPEPTAWAIMVLGFGAMGATLRRRRGAVFG